jgi:uncharacterized protein (TIGR03086 family)
MHATPFGEMPGAALAGFTAMDIVIHGWDLAKATGQDTAMEPWLAEAMLEFAQQSIGDDMSGRGSRIGPMISVPDDSDPTARLVAYLGRNP